MNAMSFIYPTVLFGVPAVCVWGWVRWSFRTKERSTFPNLSLAGFGLATLSVLLAGSTMIYAATTGGVDDYPPLLRVYKLGLGLSFGAIGLGVAGAWRPSALRWHGPVCGLGMFLFWFLLSE